MIEDAIARGSAWLVVAIYVVALILEFRRTCVHSRRMVWTLGAICLTAHMMWTIFAVHHGSLKEAYAHTAQKTQQFIGIPIGEGLYINFAMLGFWLADVTAWWIAPAWTEIRRKFVWPMHAIFGFLFFNAAIVFASGPSRIFGIAAVIVAVSAWLIPKAKPSVSPDVD